MIWTFGGVGMNTDGEGISTDGEPITGLFAAGGLTGGIFYFNYPGGAGLTNGSVFGRIAGASAAQAAKSENQPERGAGREACPGWASPAPLRGALYPSVLNIGDFSPFL